jgi:hypothetical protein
VWYRVLPVFLFNSVGVFDHALFGKLPVGKPGKRWLDAVKEDSYQMLKWRDWDVKAHDREKWRSSIKKAKVCFGL